ncbi:hypothetical protein L0F63_003978, partial [Massospora cicadina]
FTGISPRHTESSLGPLHRRALSRFTLSRVRAKREAARRGLDRPIEPKPSDQTPPPTHSLGKRPRSLARRWDGGCGADVAHFHRLKLQVDDEGLPVGAPQEKDVEGGVEPDAVGHQRDI